MSAPSKQLRSLLAARADGIRAAPTTTEALLWEQLHGSKLGVAFRRQVVIGRYIVDFCAPSIRLVVEVDGGYHDRRGQADRRRQRELERLGYRLVRLPAALVLTNIAGALTDVRAAL